MTTSQGSASLEVKSMEIPVRGQTMLEGSLCDPGSVQGHVWFLLLFASSCLCSLLSLS